MRLSIALLLLLAGCHLGPVCTTSEALTRPDGGTFACVKSDDCPLPSNTLVCASTSDYVSDCVSCQNTSCVRFTRSDCP